MNNDQKYEDKIKKVRDDAVKTGHMNFNLQFSLYKNEVISKINSDSVEEVEMAMLNKDGIDDKDQIIMSINNNVQDETIVKLIVKK